ncbi:glycogen synthase GlgA [Paenibacillus lentus]|uniref:Glycogen synthase n=1 Tax=Paenibacillus lentus TaxID=1338368 RepID=A0A3Q8S5G2_9BACL|nr:glycogen synthase GlgA [Paenibacillus lentus]AZK47413.1 glycogen synthase GlgA [Paenibacillus lentus]
MKVLFAAAEVAPFIKTGGLADVIGALPKALRQAGHDVRVVLPKYRDMSAAYSDLLKHWGAVEVPVGWRRQYGGIEHLLWEEIPVYFIDNEYYFGRDGVYGHWDDGERFAFLNRAVLEILPAIEFAPDILHCHDWHTAMIPLLLKEHFSHDPYYAGIRTVFTIHNLLYQGLFPSEVLGDLLSLPHTYYTPDAVEYNGAVSFMKAGLVFSNHVTTVSPTYAEEIKTPYYGYGMDGLLRSLGDRLSGIVNGVDTDLYNPATDKALVVTYKSSRLKKQENKIALQEELGLPISSSIPLVAMVTRLVEPKGLDLVIRILDEWLQSDEVQFVILGTGDRAYEDWFREAVYRHPEKLSAQIKFSDALSRRIYAGSDLFLMPSKFEPCGISQLLALRYGSIPVVRETGGLNDTVKSYNEKTGEGNGFTFTNFNAHDLLHTLRRGIKYYHQPEHWKQLMRNAFAGDYSWGASAKRYIDIYERLDAQTSS